MAQTHDGATEIAAKKIDISPGEYRELVSSGKKWCSRCRDWHNTDQFGKDVTRYDGRSPSCRTAISNFRLSRYVRKTKTVRGYARSYVAPREGDRKQARRRVNYLVETGLLPHPKLLPCTDCGKEFNLSGPRHEYDHYLGYANKNHEDVEVVCATCHAAREKTLRALV